MPWRLLCPVDPDLAKVTNGQRIRDFNKLPPFFYRVQYWGVMTEFWLGEGFVAGSDDLNITDAQFKWYLFEQLRDRLWSDEGGIRETDSIKRSEEPGTTHGSGEYGEDDDESKGASENGPKRKYASPLIAVFSLLEDAKMWATKQSRRTKRNCIITEIDTQKLHTTGVWKFDLNLCRAFDIDTDQGMVRKYVSGKTCDEAEWTYLIFHRLRLYPMERMFWWGPYPMAPSEHQDLSRKADTLTPNKVEVPVQCFTKWPDQLDEAIKDDFEWLDADEGAWGSANPSRPEVQHTVLIRRYNKHQKELREAFESEGL